MFASAHPSSAFIAPPARELSWSSAGAYEPLVSLALLDDVLVALDDDDDDDDDDEEEEKVEEEEEEEELVAVLSSSKLAMLISRRVE